MDPLTILAFIILSISFPKFGKWVLGIILLIIFIFIVQAYPWETGIVTALVVLFFSLLVAFHEPKDKPKTQN